MTTRIEQTKLTQTLISLTEEQVLSILRDWFLDHQGLELKPPEISFEGNGPHVVNINHTERAEVEE